MSTDPPRVDHIRYDLLAQDALRSVVRRVLSDAARSGLPGEHHFYIAFGTREPGVRISPRLLAQYPEEMTIVLQHQFWDLVVHEQAFEVSLSFNGVSERLQVPFAALRGFFDPSVQFGLQFQTAAEAATTEEADAKPLSDTKPLADAKSLADVKSDATPLAQTEMPGGARKQPAAKKAKADPARSVQEPGIQEPGVQEPGVQEPGVQEPSIQEPSAAAGATSPAAETAKTKPPAKPAEIVRLDRYRKK